MLGKEHFFFPGKCALVHVCNNWESSRVRVLSLLMGWAISVSVQNWLMGYFLSLRRWFLLASTCFLGPWPIHVLFSSICLLQEAHTAPRPAAYNSISWPQEDQAKAKAPTLVQACAQRPTSMISFNFTKSYKMGFLNYPILQMMEARFKVTCPASQSWSVIGLAKVVSWEASEGAQAGKRM